MKDEWRKVVVCIHVVIVNGLFIYRMLQYRSLVPHYSTFTQFVYSLFISVHRSITHIATHVCWHATLLDADNYERHAYILPLLVLHHCRYS